MKNWTLLLIVVLVIAGAVWLARDHTEEFYNTGPDGKYLPAGKLTPYAVRTINEGVDETGYSSAQGKYVNPEYVPRLNPAYRQPAGGSS